MRELLLVELHARTQRGKVPGREVDIDMHVDKDNTYNSDEQTFQSGDSFNSGVVP
jgi:hypothetical protein